MTQMCPYVMVFHYVILPLWDKSTAISIQHGVGMINKTWDFSILQYFIKESYNYKLLLYEFSIRKGDNDEKDLGPVSI